VIVTRDPKHDCQACGGKVLQAPALEQLIENGIPNEILVTHVLVAKYADHTPRYPSANLCTLRHHARSLDPGGLGGPHLLRAVAGACAAPGAT
jgi:transposase